MRLLLGAIIGVFMLGACDQDYSSNGTTVSFYTDKATGCHYVVQSQGGIYPRRGMPDEPAACKN